jgi:hypothetical protein
MKWFAVLLGLLVVMHPCAQENTSSDFDVDSLFGSPDEDIPEIEEKNEDTLQETEIISLVKKRGITFDASYAFYAGVAPGWDEVPRIQDDKRNYPLSWQKNQLLSMSTSFGIDAQISEVFRVLTTVSFYIPTESGFTFALGNFFFDYNMANKVFFRGGKYEHGWGISPNFGFTNLLSRVPKDGYNGEAFTFKIDIPVKIGGIQLISMTRAPVMNGQMPGIKDLGFGVKYNMALPIMDLDTGVFYQNSMAFRSFLSLKKTIGKIEAYNEWLAVIDDIKSPKKFSGAANIGFYRDFMDNNLSLNAEIFYNLEDEAFWFSPRTSFKEEEISPYLKGFNAAFNLVYRFVGKGSPRVFAQARYSLSEKSALIIPGFSLTPFKHLGLYFATPMALGSSDGYYYKNTGDINNRPYSFVILLSLSGSVRAGYYY